jgi:hypothetical protein
VLPSHVASTVEKVVDQKLQHVIRASQPLAIQPAKMSDDDYMDDDEQYSDLNYTSDEQVIIYSDSLQIVFLAACSFGPQKGASSFDISPGLTLRRHHLLTGG